jgi:hypothetical protein
LNRFELVFYSKCMSRAEQDRLMLARIAGVTRRHVRGGPLTGEQEAAALAELAEVTDGRVDLLAEHAGVLLGFHEKDLDAAVYEQMAQLCISAGADIAAIENWIGEGRMRAANARRIPFGRPGRIDR